MLKRMYIHAFLHTTKSLSALSPVAVTYKHMCLLYDDDLVICPNPRLDMCLCYQVSIYCVLQLMKTLLYTHIQEHTHIAIIDLFKPIRKYLWNIS